MRSIFTAALAVAASVCLMLSACAPAPAAARSTPILCHDHGLVTCGDHAPAAYASILPAVQVVLATFDPNVADASEPTDLVAPIYDAAKAGRWFLVGPLATILLLLGARALAPAKSAFEAWLHGSVGIWVWSLLLGTSAVLVKDLWTAGTVDLKTFGGLLGSAVIAAIIAKIRDAVPTPAAQAAKAS